MKITFLGTGTSQGVPVIACPCAVCTSRDSKDKRLRSSILITHQHKNYIIDTGPDFREQMLRANVLTLQAIIYTHQHRDHVAGMDDIRAYNFFEDRAIDVYATDVVQEELRRTFYYAFEEKRYPGTPEAILHTITNTPFVVDGLTFIPVLVYHHKMPVYGYRIGNFAYITDASRIEDDELQKIKGVDTLVINALRREKHIAHFTLEEALHMIERINPERAYLTHVSHQLGRYNDVSLELPPHVHLAYDGLEIETE